MSYICELAFTANDNNGTDSRVQVELDVRFLVSKEENEEDTDVKQMEKEA